MEHGKHEGVNRLARILENQAKKRDEFGGVGIELATVGDNYTIKPDTVDIAILPDDYMVLDYLVKRTFKTEDEGLHKHSEGAAGDPSHTHNIADAGVHKHEMIRQPGFQPGDRVLIVWFGTDAIVVGKVRKAKVMLDA